jgi:membrane-bound lytic murein transglycosylase D
MQKIFESRGLPKELVYLALVESGFSCTACSRSNAVGMWQFIHSTGVTYGLQKTEWIDERRDLLKSTRAAADYLSFLYETFEDWPLALAAYNAGENGLKKTMIESGITDFWELQETDYLPLETRDYVPKFFAAIKIIKEPQRYGFSFDPRNYKPWYETVAVPGGVNLSLLEDFIGVPKSTLSWYNPQLYKSATPPHVSSYEIRVPLGKAKIIAAEAHRLKQRKMLGFMRYKVKRGDTLYGVARKFNCSAKMLARINGISPKEKVKKGQVLNVPKNNVIALASLRNKQRAVNTFASSSKAKNTSRPVSAKSEATHYPVRQGDTLWSIAQRFNVSLQKLLACNQLSPNHMIVPGDLLTICFGE